MKLIYAMGIGVIFCFLSSMVWFLREEVSPKAGFVLSLALFVLIVMVINKVRSGIKS